MIAEPFQNLFQELLYHDIRNYGAILIARAILGLYFPAVHREPEFYMIAASFIEAGMPPACVNEPWSPAACESFCKQAAVKWGETDEQNVLFVRGDLCPQSSLS